MTESNAEDGKVVEVVINTETGTTRFTAVSDMMIERIVSVRMEMKSQDSMPVCMMTTRLHLRVDLSGGMAGETHFHQEAIQGTEDLGELDSVEQLAKNCFQTGQLEVAVDCEIEVLPLSGMVMKTKKW